MREFKYGVGVIAPIFLLNLLPAALWHGHGMGWSLVLLLVFLGHLAFGGMLGEEVGTFRS